VVDGRAEVSLRSDGCASAGGGGGSVGHGGGGGGSSGSDVRRVEHVQAVISLTASRRGHLQLYLTSPGGTRSTLLAPRSGKINAAAARRLCCQQLVVVDVVDGRAC